MGKRIEVRCGNVVVTIYRTRRIKNGKTYVSHTIVDFSGGKRRLRYAAKLDKAKAMAKAIAAATVQGKSDVVNWEDGLRVEIRKAIEAVATTGVSILSAAKFFSEAVKILGGHDQLLTACQYWTQKRPDKPIIPKTCNEAAEVLNAKQAINSARRQRNVAYNLDMFTRRFGSALLHTVEPVELKDYADGKKWSPKTYNEFLATVSLLYKEAKFRGWVSADCNPAKAIKRQKLKASPIHIFEPWEARRLLNRISGDLVPFFALWLFAGIRKEEVSRMNWQQVNRGLETGRIYLEANQTKTGQARSVPVQDNLKMWLLAHRKNNGDILAADWKGIDRLSEITRYASRKTGIVWQGNAPRHSFATYFFKLNKDAGATVSAMGTSLAKFQKHYWNRSDSVTEAVAQEWFNIRPAAAEKITPMPKAAGA